MSSTHTDRRRFLSLCTKVLMTAVGLLVALPVLGNLLEPLRRKRGAESNGLAFQDLGPLSDIPVGQWRLLLLEVVRQDGWEKTRVRQSVWVRRQPEGEGAITVLAALCTHLGCPVSWHPDQSQFLCPCHKGVFNAEGQPVSGPLPRSMDPLEFEVRDGQLWVRWQDFKVGTTERIPANG